MKLLGVPIGRKYFNSWGLESIFFPSKKLSGVTFPQSSWGYCLCTGILEIFEVCKSTSGRTGVYSIPGGYITKFHSINVEINDGIAEISGS